MEDGVTANSRTAHLRHRWGSSALKLDKSTLFPPSFDKTAREMKAAKRLLGLRAKRSHRPQKSARWLLVRAAGRFRDPTIGLGIAPLSPLTTVQGVGCLFVGFFKDNHIVPSAGGWYWRCSCNTARDSLAWQRCRAPRSVRAGFGRPLPHAFMSPMGPSPAVGSH